MSNWSPFVDPVGLMMALMPLPLADRWQGVLGPTNEPNEYEKVRDECDRRYANLRNVDGWNVLLFGGDRLPMSWLSASDNSLIIVREICTPNRRFTTTHAEQIPTEHPLDIIEEIPLHDQVYRLIDVTGPAEEETRSHDTLQLVPGFYRLNTWELSFKTDTEIVLHRLDRKNRL